MRIHHATAHGESLVEQTAMCNHCEEEFEVPAGATGQFCSTDCRDASMREGERRECVECGEMFHAAEWELDEGRQFCSHACYAASLEDRDRYECAGCGRDFSVYSAANIRYCSRSCMAEDRMAAPRPDDLDGLIWLLYVYEDVNLRATWLRANNHHDEWLTQDDVATLLRENDWMDESSGGTAKYEDLTAADVGLEGEPDDPDESWKKYYSREVNDE